MYRNRVPYPSLIILIPGLVLLLGITFLIAGVSQAAVTLLYFQGEWQTPGIFLEWETATELDNSGFYVKRGNSVEGPFERVSQFFPSRGDSLTGGYYSHVDTNGIVPGQTYWYLLEAVDNGGHSSFDGPVQIYAGVQQPATSTPTSTVTTTQSQDSQVTATRTPTRTSVGSSPTRTRTPTNVPTITSRFFTATSPNTQATPFTPAPTAFIGDQGVISPTAVVSGTATLIPLPEITMIFPSPQAAVISDSNAGSTNVGDSGADRKPFWIVLGRLAFLVFILLFWLILGGWFYYSSRRIE